jgi:hypothetical protein
MMGLRFTKQDAITLALGCAGAAPPVLAQAFASLDVSKTDDLDTWAIGLGSGLVTALTRYLWTRLAEKAGVTSQPDEELPLTPPPPPGG